MKTSVSAEVRTELYIKCPICEIEEFTVGHLKKGQTTVWGCECGGHFKLECRAGGVFILEPIKRRTNRTIVTLESKGPVRLLVKGISLTDNDGNANPEQEQSDEYFYNEHTCPTNFLGVEKVIDPEDGDEDPHGIFAYVKTEPYVKKDN